MQGIPAKDYFNYQICRVQKTLSLILYHMTKGKRCKMLEKYRPLILSMT